MSENRNSRQKRKSSFVKKKQKTPIWIIACFIGVPILVILVLLGMILKNLLTGGPSPKPEKPDPAIIMQEGDKLYNEGIRLKNKAYAAKNSDKKPDLFITAAIKKLSESQKKYKEILDEIKLQNNGEIPPEFGGYTKKMNQIQQAKEDLLKMLSLY